MSLTRAERPRDVPRPPETLNIDTLFREHGGRVSRWAAGLGGPAIDVEEVVQEVFVVAHRRLPEFRGEAKISTWLFRITMRVVQHQRRRARWRRWLAESAQDVAADLPSPQLDPVETLIRKQAVGELYAILDQMSDKWRTVLVLANFEQLGAEEIASMNGVKPATARVWLHRARLEFQRLSERRRRGRP
ncbi:MAG TPA: sigma-70 family RNA polymerase sigma factor [Polyangia bacterium]